MIDEPCSPAKAARCLGIVTNPAAVLADHRIPASKGFIVALFAFEAGRMFVSREWAKEREAEFDRRMAAMKEQGGRNASK